MARGKTAEVGATRVAPNGYHYTKTEDRDWVLTHWLVMEQKLGRKINPDTESVRFQDKKVKRTLAETGTCDVSGLILIKKRTASIRKRIAVLEAQIADKQAELADLKREAHLE
jgi:hypothetical protein